MGYFGERVLHKMNTALTIIPKEYYFRIENRIVGSVDEFGDISSVYTVQLYLHKFEVIKKTPKGVWIRDYSIKGKQFILSSPDGKRFAYLNIEDSIRGFIKRKQRQIQILSTKLADTKMALYLAENKQINGILKETKPCS